MRIEKVTFTARLTIYKKNSVKITIPQETIDKIKQNFNKSFVNGEICDFQMEFPIKEKEDKK